MKFKVGDRLVLGEEKIYSSTVEGFSLYKILLRMRHNEDLLEFDISWAERALNLYERKVRNTKLAQAYHKGNILKSDKEWIWLQS